MKIGGSRTLNPRHLIGPAKHLSGVLVFLPEGQQAPASRASPNLQLWWQVRQSQGKQPPLAVPLRPLRQPQSLLPLQPHLQEQNVPLYCPTPQQAAMLANHSFAQGWKHQLRHINTLPSTL